MLKKAAEGVRVFMQYDELGSKDLSKEYISELRDAGVEIFPFNTTQGKGNRFSIELPQPSQDRGNRRKHCLRRRTQCR